MICTFIPPHLSRKVAETDKSFSSGLKVDTTLRGARQGAVASVEGPIRVYTAANKTVTPGSLVQDGDEAAERVRGHCLLIQQLLGTEEFPDGVVHYGRGYANAFFNGNYLVFGEGDGQVFGDFTKALDITSHELGHALVAMGPRLVYSGESGALNEHLADVFGTVTQQWAVQDPRDWRIGQEIMLDSSSAVRNMLDPGTAYDNALLGKDPQVGHMDQYRKIRADNGGVHINSGIPNKAFALLCEQTQEPSWGRPLAMWRRAMEDLTPTSTFRAMAQATWRHSGGLNPAVKEAWAAVGIEI